MLRVTSSQGDDTTNESITTRGRDLECKKNECLPQNKIHFKKRSIFLQTIQGNWSNE